MTTTEERRLAKRITFKEPVRYELKDPAYFKGCVAYDLSETGVRLRITEFLPKDTEVILNIGLKNGMVVECMGRIAWVSQIPFMDHYQVGIEFLKQDLLIEPRKQIRQLVHEN